MKKISIRKHPGRYTFVVQYEDGRRVETPYVEILGPSTLYLDALSKEPVIRTEANISLGASVKNCVVCGKTTEDNHAHA